MNAVERMSPNVRVPATATAECEAHQTCTFGDVRSATSHRRLARESCRTHTVVHQPMVLGEATMKSLVSGYSSPILLWLAMATATGFAGDGRIELRPRVFTTNGALAIEFWSGKECVGLAPAIAPAGIQLRLPGGEFESVLF